MDADKEGKPGMTFRERLLEKGWHHGQTGGGFTAYMKATNDPSVKGKPQGWYWLMIDSICPDAPTESDQMVTVGLYDHDGIVVIQLNFNVALILDGQIVIEDTYV